MRSVQERRFRPRVQSGWKRDGSRPAIRLLTRAAKQLEMRQPSISQQLSKMERQLGGKLIRFVNNEMRLTQAGEFLRGLILLGNHAGPRFPR